MLQVSLGALASLILLLVICFVLPIGLFTLLFRLADSRFKTFGVGAIAYLVSFVAEALLLTVIGYFTDMTRNMPVYMLYSLLLSPAVFMAVNYFAMNRFGKDTLAHTGDVMMYAVGQTALQNVITTGFIALMYFLTLWGIRSGGGQFVVVSDADYISYSDTVSASNLVNESVYQEMKLLCERPAGYFLALCFDRIWVIVVYAAILLVLWLAVRRREKLPLLGIALVLRLMVGLPTIFSDFHIIKSTWLSTVVVVIIAVIAWIAAVFCWRSFIDEKNEENVESVDSAE